MTIFIAIMAEDDAINRIVVLDMLEQLGHHADAANDGMEALVALEWQTYDVVLMDVQMPAWTASKSRAASAARKETARHRRPHGSRPLRRP